MALFTGLPARTPPVDNLWSRPNPLDAIIHQPPPVTYSEKIAKDFSSWDEKAAERQALLDQTAARARQLAPQEFAAWNPADADRFAAQEAAREFGAMTQYGIDAPRTAATPSGAYTASELDAITQAAQRDAQAEESKSFMEKLGFTQPTRDDLTPAFRGLDPGRYNINQYDPLGVGGYHISQNRGLFDPLSLGLQAASAAPGIPGAFGPLSTAFMGITEAMAEARAVDRAREMYGLPTTKSYQRSYQPTPREGIAAGIGQFFGLGTDPLFDEAELAAPGFAGYLGDVGAETGARSRSRPDYTGTTGYAPGERAYDRYAYHYNDALDEYNRNMAQAMQMPESPDKADLISYYSQLHPNFRQQELEDRAFQDSAWERGEWDFTLDPITYASGESTIGWTDPQDLNDPNKGLVDPMTGLMYTAALDRMNPDFDKLLDVNERINAARIAGIEAREETLEKNQREALEQMEQTNAQAQWDIVEDQRERQALGDFYSDMPAPSDPGYSDETESWGESIGGGW